MKVLFKTKINLRIKIKENKNNISGVIHAFG